MVLEVEPAWRYFMIFCIILQFVLWLVFIDFLAFFVDWPVYHLCLDYCIKVNLIDIRGVTSLWELWFRRNMILFLHIGFLLDLSHTCLWEIRLISRISMWFYISGAMILNFLISLIFIRQHILIWYCPRNPFILLLFLFRRIFWKLLIVLLLQLYLLYLFLINTVYIYLFNFVIPVKICLFIISVTI